MASNKNIFCATNPARVADALWHVIVGAGVENLSRMLVFLPSRRAVRTVEKMIAQKMGGAAILPRLVALGEGDELSDTDDDATTNGNVSDMARVVMLARLLAADANVGNLSTALPIARDLVRMQNYLENEGIDASQIDWSELVDEKYAAHFQGKAQLLNILTRVMPEIYGARETDAAARNRAIRAWRDGLNKYACVIVCASTASVPATADLMVAVANSDNGKIILSGKIAGNVSDFELDTNPYNSEYKFLLRMGLTPADVIPIDVGASAIDFMNAAFGNSGAIPNDGDALSHCKLIECNRESEEAAVVAEIAARCAATHKSVLVITPDAAGNQRIANAIARRHLDADFSGGTTGTMTPFGRAILNAFDDWIAANDTATFDRRFLAAGFDLFEMILRMTDDGEINFTPAIDLSDAATAPIADALRETSECINSAGIKLTLTDARAFIADAIGTVSVRGQMNENADIVVLGTIESRMQTADVVILTGLNDGMFPARGYENAWLPTKSAEKIGLPSSDRKVSLQSLDFMNLSCGPDVYWTRSRTAGGVQTTESRFISRVAARHGAFDTTTATDILSAVRTYDTPPPRILDYSAPTPPADWSDVYVTEIETLIHNPYAFYVRHILCLRVLDDYWVGPDARAFGNLVHGVIENATDFSPDALVAEMDRCAQEILGTDSILFHFWHKRFLEIAPVVAVEFNRRGRGFSEIAGTVEIANRRIRARADRVWNDVVMDIKTGAAPNKSQLSAGTMPQLPLEAYMLQSGGFGAMPPAAAPTMVFLQLKNRNVRIIEYDAPTTQQMIDAAVSRVTDLVNMYSAGHASYEYYETGDAKYQIYDDLARRFD